MSYFGFGGRAFQDLRGAQTSASAFPGLSSVHLPTFSRSHSSEGGWDLFYGGGTYQSAFPCVSCIPWDSSRRQTLGSHLSAVFAHLTIRFSWVSL